ncbi:putative amidophosphoribosyltransferase [Bradyrhizobium sp. CIR3A]|nr:putative amidophosphoribosyltransferase [Bradyrhizobium sp. CIR3A]
MRRCPALPRPTPEPVLFIIEAPMICEFCETEIPIGLSVCPACGKPQSAPGQTDRRALWFVLIVVVMFGIAVAEHHLVFSH